MTRRRPFTLLVAMSVLVPLSACGDSGGGSDTSSSARGYPTEDISMIIPYAAGGPTDTVARALAPAFSDTLGQTVLPENREGGSGALGMATLLNSEPDGHTMMLIASSAAVVTPLVQDVGYDETDYVTVGAITQYPYIMAVRADSEYPSAEELFAAAKANPDSVKVGVPGAASQGAVELQRLAESHGVTTTAVPFEGNAGSVAALLGGNVDAIFLVASEDVLSQVEAGEFRAVAVGSAERASYLPETPTLSELGYDDLTLGTSYYGLALPAGTPKEVVAKVEDTLEAALEDPEVVERVGEKYVPEEFIAGTELAELFEEQRKVYTPILKDDAS